MTCRWLSLLTLVVVAATASSAGAAVRITEWMYNPLGATNAEYVEITNLGPGSVDMTGWSFDDSSQTAGSFSLSSLGTLAVGESALITEAVEAAFRTEWSLAAAVKVAAENTQNLGRSDEINIYDAANALVDRLTYNDQGTGDVAGPRTQGISGNPPNLAALGANNASIWVLSSVGDLYGSVASVSADVGNPGKFLIPEPAGCAMALIGLMAVAARRRRRG